MTASDYVPTHPDLLLASEGASTDAVQKRTCKPNYIACAGTFWSVHLIAGRQQTLLLDLIHTFEVSAFKHQRGRPKEPST